MTNVLNVLILDANGQLAHSTTCAFLRDTDAKLTLYLRRASRLRNPAPAPVQRMDDRVGVEQPLHSFAGSLLPPAARVSRKMRRCFT
jgi:hypothetical protein